MTELWISVIVAFAHAVETTTGFGGTVIALAIGVHIVPIERLIVSLMAIGWLQAAWILSKDHEHVEAGLLMKTVIPVAAIGVVAGFMLRSALESSSLKMVLGAFVVTVAAIELYRLARTGASRPLAPWPSRLVLVSGGLFHGLFASGGPAIVYWSSRMIEDKRRFRATLAALWLVLNTSLLTAAAFAGTFDRAALFLSAAALPGLLVGIVVGELLHAKVPQRAFRGIVNGLLLLTGIVLLT